LSGFTEPGIYPEYVSTSINLSLSFLCANPFI
jgi:hypothetical protein